MRKIWTPGMFLGFASKNKKNDNGMTNLHVIDNVTIENTDPWTAWFKESRRG